MSYDIVRGIKIENGEVLINASANNICPHHFEWGKCESLTNLLKEKGMTELELALMRDFEEGNFQSSLNLKYTRALKVLKYLLKNEYAMIGEIITTNTAQTNIKPFKNAEKVRRLKTFF